MLLLFQTGRVDRFTDFKNLEENLETQMKTREKFEEIRCNNDNGLQKLSVHLVQLKIKAMKSINEVAFNGECSH